ncbi:acyl-homoserine-lactone synthase [Enterobacillus tribolii]|uniref:Acyl-homoserine-lactone synthase n=1 Tax=Enterobacillus tribolii TaxID=1487935 RepID=A0A370R2G0_9GAMM|nr:acyl-homoserine-lactone synthase [Enterobacillus tribolii]MBW7983691.1 acyl-homoserine-lactone synthase [Enterobacillus tribolii]RDK96621.1 acyl homoserine lactone synthase [Enterobacillus tribolii]
MLRIFDLNYRTLSKSSSEEFFTLRKETFKDRLNWAVNCTDGMEFDEYDNSHANYLFGVKDDTMICSVRFIEMKYPNMIVNTFHPYFKKIDLPQGNFIESSRFFVDKTRAKSLLGARFPISYILFLSMINYAREHNYEGIFTLVSHPMLMILKRSGWRISVIETGLSEKSEKIYILLLPIDQESQNALIDKILSGHSFGADAMKTWPLELNVGSILQPK